MNGVRQFLSYFPSIDYSSRLVKCAEDERNLTAGGIVAHTYGTSWASQVCDEKEVPGRNSESYPARKVSP